MLTKADKEQAKTALLLIKGAITELPQAQQEDIKEVIQQVKDTISHSPSDIQFIAITYIALEMQAGE